MVFHGHKSGRIFPLLYTSSASPFAYYMLLTLWEMAAFHESERPHPSILSKLFVGLQLEIVIKRSRHHAAAI